MDYLEIIKEGIELGFDSVMVDGSRLDLDENIKAIQRVVELACPHDVPVEAELGAVVGHENELIPSYEQILKSRHGFTICPCLYARRIWKFRSGQCAYGTKNN